MSNDKPIHELMRIGYFGGLMSDQFAGRYVVCDWGGARYAVATDGAQMCWSQCDDDVGVYSCINGERMADTGKYPVTMEVLCKHIVPEFTAETDDVIERAAESVRQYRRDYGNWRMDAKVYDQELKRRYDRHYRVADKGRKKQSAEKAVAVYVSKHDRPKEPRYPEVEWYGQTFDARRINKISHQTRGVTLVGKCPDKGNAMMLRPSGEDVDILLLAMWR